MLQMNAVQQAEAHLAAVQREPSRDWVLWLLLPWLALSVALEDALRCWERRLR